MASSLEEALQRYLADEGDAPTLSSSTARKPVPALRDFSDEGRMPRPSTAHAKRLYQPVLTKRNTNLGGFGKGTYQSQPIKRSAQLEAALEAFLRDDDDVQPEKKLTTVVRGSARASKDHYEPGTLLAAVRNKGTDGFVHASSMDGSLSFLEQFAAAVPSNDHAADEHAPPPLPRAAEEAATAAPLPRPAASVGTLSVLNLSELTVAEPSKIVTLNRDVAEERETQKPKAEDCALLKRIRDQRIEVARLTRALLHKHPKELFVDLFRTDQNAAEGDEHSAPPIGQDSTQNPHEASAGGSNSFGKAKVDSVTGLPPPPPSDWLQRIHKDQVRHDRQRIESKRLDRVMTDLASRQRSEGVANFAKQCGEHTPSNPSMPNHNTPAVPDKLKQIQCQVMLSYVLQAAEVLEAAAQQRVTRDAGVGPPSSGHDISGVATPGFTPVESMVMIPPGALNPQSLLLSRISHGQAASPHHAQQHLSMMMSPHEAQIISANANARRGKLSGSGDSSNSKSNKKSSPNDESSLGGAGRTGSSSPSIVPPLPVHQLTNSNKILVSAQAHDSTKHHHSDDEDDSDADSPQGFQTRGNVKFHDSTLMTVGGPTTATGLNTTGTIGTTGQTVSSTSASGSRSHTPATDGASSALPSQKPPIAESSAPPSASATARGVAAATPPPQDRTATAASTPRGPDSARKPPTPRTKPSAKPKKAKSSGFFGCFGGE